MVQLPGVQDTAKAKDIRAGTATLELELHGRTKAPKAAQPKSGGPCPLVLSAT